MILDAKKIYERKIIEMVVMNNKSVNIPEEVIDKILSFDQYGNIDIILAFGLKTRYIEKLSNIIKNDKDSGFAQFINLWRLEYLVNTGINTIDQKLLDNLPKELWTRISMKPCLRESFIVKNSHNLNLARVKYFRKGALSYKFHEAFPDFKNINKCTECFESDAISGPHFRPNCDILQKLCELCLEKLCKRCGLVEFFSDEEYGECIGCPQYDYDYKYYNLYDDIQ